MINLIENIADDGTTYFVYGFMGESLPHEDDDA